MNILKFLFLITHDLPQFLNALSEQVRTALKEKKPKLTSLSFVARARFTSFHSVNIKGNLQSSSPCDVVFSSYALYEQVRTALKEKKPKLTSLSFVARARFELAASGL